MKHTIHILKLVAPWVVAIVIFAWLFHIYPIDTVLNAGKHVNILWFSAFALFYYFFIMAMDTWALSHLLKQHSFPIKFSDLWPARAITYIIMILNYGASQAAFAFYLKRTKQVPVLEVLGLLVFIALVDLYWLMGLAVVGSYAEDFQIHGVHLAQPVRLFGLAAVVALLFHMIFWHYFSKKPWRINTWLRGKALFRVFSESRFSDYVRLSLMRIPVHACIISCFYIVLLTFGAYVPFMTTMGATPVAFILGVLPISPSGLGVTNGALVELLQQYVKSPLISSGEVSAPALILAASLLWIFANMLLKALVGIFYMSRVSKDLFKPD